MIKLPVNKQKILDTVEREYQSSIKTVLKKRMKFREQDKLMNDVTDTDKIDLKTLYYVINTMMAIYYSDQIVVDFSPRKFGAEQQSKNLTSLAKFDYNEMNLSVIDYKVQMNKLLRGVGIKAMTGWDNIKQCPIVEAIDTRQWIPDPNGWFDPSGFRFHGFEVTMNISDMTEDAGYDKDAVDKLTILKQQENIITRNYAQRTAGLSPNIEEGDMGDNQTYDIYHHFTTIEGKKYLITLGNNRKEIIKFVEIEPVTEEEKQNNNLIPFPVSLYYFSPREYDPYGTNVVDLLQDKHRYKNILANLMFIREKDAALGDDVLYDTNMIKNRQDLKVSTLNKKLIGVDGTRGDINKAVSVIPRNPAPTSSYNFSQFLDRSVELAVGIDARQIGVQGEQNITATEAQQLQANNNLKSILQNRINAVGEKYFWKLWMRAYRQHFKSSEKKVVRVTNSFGSKNIEFSKDDFITSNDPDIDIRSLSEIKSKRDASLANLTPLLMSVIQDPNKPAIAKNLAERKLYELNGIEDDESIVYAPPTYEEMDAIQKLELINNNNMEGAKIDEPNVDHMTYIVIFQRAIDNPVKFAAIEARKNMIIMMGQHQQIQQSGASGINQMSNQMLNQAQQQNNQTKVQSRENITQ